MQMRPFAGNKCLRTFAVPESGVYACSARRNGGATAGFPALTKDLVSLSSVQTTTLE
jgi:hypothetical protein